MAEIIVYLQYHLFLIIVVAGVYIAVRARRLGWLLVLLLLSDFVVINLKVLATQELVLGGWRDAVLVASATLLLLGRKDNLKCIMQLLLIYATILASINNPEYRIYYNLFAAYIIGYHVTKDVPPFSFGVSKFIVVGSFLIGTYQYVTFTNLEELWFYDYLLAKMDQDFINSLYAYTRSEALRPPGYMVSPSIFALVFFVLNFSIDLSGVKYNLHSVFLKAFIAIPILLSQTRVLIITFIAYELVNLAYKLGFRTRRLVLLYAPLLLVVLLLISISDDPSALRRLEIYAEFGGEFFAGKHILPFIATDGLFTDSQIVSLLKGFGLLSFIILIPMFKAAFSGQLNSSIGFVYRNFALAFIFISIFQYSGDAASNIAAAMLIGSCHRFCYGLGKPNAIADSFQTHQHKNIIPKGRYSAL